MSNSLPTLSQALVWAQIRQHALEQIMREFPDHPAAKIAGLAMTIGPGSKQLAALANEAMET